MSLDKFIGSTKKRKKISEDDSSVSASEEVSTTKDSIITTNKELNEQKIIKNGQLIDIKNTLDNSVAPEKKVTVIMNENLENENISAEQNFSYSDILEIAKYHPLYMNYLNDVLWILKDKSIIDPEQYLDIKFNMPKPLIRILLVEAQKISNTIGTDQ